MTFVPKEAESTAYCRIFSRFIDSPVAEAFLVLGDPQMPTLSIAFASMANCDHALPLLLRLLVGEPLERTHTDELRQRHQLFALPRRHAKLDSIPFLPFPPLD